MGLRRYQRGLKKKPKGKVQKMRYIEMKITTDEDGSAFKYQALLFNAVKMRSPGREDTLDYDEMERLRSALVKIRDTKDLEFAELTDEEFTHVVRKVKKMDWTRATDTAYQFCKDVINAPSEDPRKKEDSTANNEQADTATA